MSTVDQKQLLKDFGYVKHQNISNNGNIFLAYNQNEPVVIKKVSKASLEEYSAVFRLPAHHNFANLTDSFESEKTLYFVLEYNFNVNLSEFVLQCFNYIKEGKLKAKYYRKKMKYLLAKLVQTLHSDCVTCTLSTVNIDNIMVRNAEFIHNADGSIAINPKIDIVYINILGTDDAINDVYGFGLIMYFCFVGQHVSSETEQNEEFNAMWAIRHNKLKQYLLMNKLAICVNKKILSLLTSLLNIDASQTPNAHSILMHPFFNKGQNSQKK
eukprot:424609_1